MSQEFGDDLITITDEDGVEYELEVLCSLEYNGETYLALVAADAGDAEELEVSILKVVNEDDEEFFVGIEDEDELQAVYKAMMDQIYAEEEAE